MVLLTNGSPLGQESSFCFFCGRPIRGIFYDESVVVTK